MLWIILAMLLITGLVGFFGSLTPVSGAIKIFVICALVVLAVRRILRFKDEY